MQNEIARTDLPGRLTRLWRAALGRPLASGLGILALTSLTFLLAPGLDLAVSTFFYVPPADFPGGRSAELENLRVFGRCLEWVFALATLVPLAIKVAWPDSDLILAPRKTLFVLASFALGPGLIVNGILKEHWGRARPRAIIEFGGNEAFSPAWWLSDQCERNCSFVSGEASSAFCLVALVFLVRREWRPGVAVLTLAFAAAISFTRIAAGAHFLSDVLIAWLVTLCVMLALKRLLLDGLPAHFDASVEQSAGRAGLTLRRLFAPPPPPSASR